MPVAIFTGGGIRPQLQSATALTSTRIRVEFSEPINLATAPLGAFTLTALGSSVARTLTTVSAPSLTFLEFDTSGALSTGSPAYRIIAATTVADLAGNTIDPAARQLDFNIAAVSSITYTLSPSAVVDANGGTQLTFTRTGGSPLPDGLYTVEFTSGTYSKFALGEDRPELTYVRAIGGVMRFASPEGPAGTYTLTLRSVSGGALTEVLTSTVALIQPSFYSKTYGYRRWFVPKFDVGARSVGDE